MTKIKISDLKSLTGVGFGTSGVRDLNEKLTDRTVYIYTKAFLQLTKEKTVAIAGDKRFSTHKIMTAVYKAIIDNGQEVINTGKIPTPAVTYFGVQNKIPSIMITGSHIPEDRNGVKFSLSSGEILKLHEKIISEMEVEFNESLFDSSGEFVKPYILPAETRDAYDLYLNRYTDFFDNDLFLNQRIGLYGHSAVGRSFMEELFFKLGGEVIKIDYSDDVFIPVDTEIADQKLVDNCKLWKEKYNLDLIASTDGDGDRPLLSDENGDLIKSELLPIFTAKYLNITDLVVTLSSNTCVEKSNWFNKIIRTKIGSPYVISGINELIDSGSKLVAGYEANGGFLLGSKIGNLEPLLTRDAILPILCLPAMAKKNRMSISTIVKTLPQRQTYSSSIKGIPTEKSLAVLENWEIHKNEIESVYGKIVDVNLLDGLRLTFENEDVVHFRPSKNAPEFRNYAESDTYEKAKDLSEKAIDFIKEWTETDTI